MGRTLPRSHWPVRTCHCSQWKYPRAFMHVLNLWLSWCRGPAAAPMHVGSGDCLSMGWRAARGASGTLEAQKFFKGHSG